MHVLWPAVGRVLHDETIEGIFDNLERAVTGDVDGERRRPRRARVLERLLAGRVARPYEQP